MIKLGKFAIFIALTVISSLGYAASVSSTSPEFISSKPTNQTQQFPVHYVDTSVVSNEAYYTESLPACPGDPVLMQKNAEATITNFWGSITINTAIYPGGVGWPSAPVCPDINGKYSVADQSIIGTGPLYGYRTDPIRNKTYFVPTAYCPNQCVTTRYVQKDSFNNIVSTTAPVCPVGYVQVGQFNMQDEIVYKSYETSINSAPFTDLDDFKKQTGVDYASAKFYGDGTSSDASNNPQVRCEISDSWKYTLTTPCVSASATAPDNGEAWDSGYLFYTLPDSPYNSFYFATTISRYDPDTNSTVSGVGVYYGYSPLGVWTDVAAGGGCKDDLAGTEDSSQSCSVITSGYADLQCRTSDFAGSHIVYSTNFDINWGYLACYQKPGLYYSGKKIPYSIICARSGTAWSNGVPNK